MKGGEFDTFSNQSGGRRWGERWPGRRWPGGRGQGGLEEGGLEPDGFEPGEYEQDRDELGDGVPEDYESVGDEPDWREPVGHGVDGHGVDGRGADGHGADGRGADGHGVDGHGADGHSADGHDLGAMTYWRRRFIALAVGLGVLSLIAWAFSGTFAASQAGGSAAAGGARGTHGHSAGAGADSAGSGGASRPAGQPQTAGSAAESPTARPSASALPSASPATGAQAQASHAPAQLAALAPHRASHPARACKPGNVVISLFVGQDNYGQGQLPEFDVNVVSTGTRTCGFNVGARHLSLVVREHGKRVWVSAECTAGRGGLTANLARGVPVIVPVSWNRQTSALACQGTGQQAPAGRYTASASDDGVASNPVRFTIG